MTNVLSFDNPEILQKYGNSWDNFAIVVNDELSRIQKLLWRLYDINNISTMSEEVINYEIAANDIPIVTDTINAKKAARRKYVSNFKKKGDPDVYLDIAEAITGIRGEIISGSQLAGNQWDVATWPEIGGVAAESKRWPGSFPYLEVWINVKTNGTVLIDRILNIYRSRNYRPAFLQIYLTDDTYSILGVVNE